MRRIILGCLLLLAVAVEASTPSYWFSQLQVKPDAQQAQQFWFQPGANMTFTYANNLVYLNASGGGGGNTNVLSNFFTTNAFGFPLALTNGFIDAVYGNAHYYPLVGNPLGFVNAAFVSGYAYPLFGNPSGFINANQTITLTTDADSLTSFGTTSIPLTVTNIHAALPAQGKFLARNATGVVWSNLPPPGASSQTPWLGTEDAANYSLVNLASLTVNSITGTNGGSFPFSLASDGTLHLHVSSGDLYMQEPGGGNGPELNWGTSTFKLTYSPISKLAQLYNYDAGEYIYLQSGKITIAPALVLPNGLTCDGASYASHLAPTLNQWTLISSNGQPYFVCNPGGTIPALVDPGQFVLKAGDTMSGGLTMSGTSSIVGTNVYLSDPYGEHLGIYPSFMSIVGSTAGDPTIWFRHDYAGWPAVRTNTAYIDLPNYAFDSIHIAPNLTIDGGALFCGGAVINTNGIYYGNGSGLTNLQSALYAGTATNLYGFTAATNGGPVAGSQVTGASTITNGLLGPLGYQPATNGAAIAVSQVATKGAILTNGNDFAISLSNRVAILTNRSMAFYIGTNPPAAPLTYSNVFQIDAANKDRAFHISTNGNARFGGSLLDVGDNTANAALRIYSDSGGALPHSLTSIGGQELAILANGARVLSLNKDYDGTSGHESTILKNPSLTGVGSMFGFGGSTGSEGYIKCTSSGNLLISNNITVPGYISATNGFNYLRTNPAPTSVIVGVTPPDAWVWFTNGGTAFAMPAWMNH